MRRYTPIQRSDDAEDSEALSLGGLFKAGTSIVSGIASLFGGDGGDQNQRRELLELLARDADDESGAINFLNFIKSQQEIAPALIRPNVVG